MEVWVVVNEHAPEHKPNHRDNAKDVKGIRPTTGYILHNDTTQEV